MRGKFLTFLLAVMAGLVAVGCGSDDSVDAAAGDTDPATGYEDEADAPAAYAGPVDEAQGLADVTGENDDYGQVPEDEIVPWDEMKEETTEAETGEVEGIIVLQADWSDLYRPTYAVIGINPADGTWHNISDFYFDSVFERTNPEYTIVPALQFGRYANLYDQFSSDYSKAAATKTFASNGEVHAGWIDTAGNFFDVTEALDEQSHGDFDDAVSYQAVGFQNNVFIYVHSEGFEKNQYYGVEVDNITPGASWEISAVDPMICEDYATWQYIRGYKPTCWIDDDRLIVEANNQSYIATISTQSVSEYIPASESRYSWSAVASPDRRNVAFLSEAKSGTTGNVGIYIMPFGCNSDPIKQETNFIPQFTMSSGHAVKSFGTKGVCCYLLEWR